MKVYLAGPIKGLSYDDATNWREAASHDLIKHGIEPLSPMRYKEYLSRERELKDSYGFNPLSSDKGVITRDRWDIQRCDIVLMYLVGAEAISIGTMIEVGWANAYQKPIVAVMTLHDIHWHGMVRECSGFIAPTLQQACDIIYALNTDNYGAFVHNEEGLKGY